MIDIDSAPLSSKQITDKHKIKDAYADYWNHIKFQRGWEQPAVQLKEVQNLLDEAADICIRIRSALDAKDPSFKLRMVWLIQDNN